jgi:hypothetical protein
MSKSPYWEWGHTSNMVISFSHIFTNVDKTMPFAPSPSHQHVYRWYVETSRNHSQSWVVYCYFTHIISSTCDDDLITNLFCSQPARPSCHVGVGHPGPALEQIGWPCWTMSHGSYLLNMLDSKPQGSPTFKQHIQTIRYTHYQRTNENTGYTPWFWLYVFRI